MKNKKAKIFSIKYLFFDLIRLSSAIPSLLALRLKRLYVGDAAKKKIKGGWILASNHTGYFDIMFLMTAVWYRRIHFVVTKKLFEGKHGRFWATCACQCIEIDGDNPGMSSIREGVAHLKNEEVVGIFPEGHINEGNANETLGEFKSGVALMAIMSGKPIVPVYIHKRKNVFERLKVVFGEPIYVDEEERKKSPLRYRNALSQLIYDKEKELQEFCERKYGKRN